MAPGGGLGLPAGRPRGVTWARVRPRGRGVRGFDAGGPSKARRSEGRGQGRGKAESGKQNGKKPPGGGSFTPFTRRVNAV